MWAQSDFCRALVLSGGGNNGAWEAGVFYGLVNYSNPEDYAYDVITGVSAGSINTLAFSGWEKGKEIELAQWLSDLWKDLKTENVWQDWPIGGKVAGLTTKSGAIDNSPLLNYLRGIASSFPDFKRRVTLSAVEVETG